MPPNRDALRRELRARRRSLAPQQRIVGADGLATQLLSLPAARWGYVAGYWAMDGEIALHAWQIKLPPGCVYCLPVLHDEQQLRFSPWRPGDPLVTNRFGIPEPDVAIDSLLEPTQMNCVVAPLVGFDRRGHRLGMGGGWYDRSFDFRRDRPGAPLLVGAAFDVQLLDAIEPAPWDVSLDMVCTESTQYDCRDPSSDGRDA